MGMSLLATTDTQIIRVIEALYNQRPGSIFLNNFQTFVTENSIDDFANSLAANFASSTDAELAAIVTGNLGLTGGALTAGNAYLEAQFTANSAARGKVILDAMNTLSGMESDAVYGAAATLYNADITASLTYSSVAANTAVTSSDAASDVVAGQTFALTTAVDVMTGSVGNDSFTGDNSGTSNKLTSADQLDGGDGTDSLNIFSSGDGDVAGLLTSIETINLYDLDDTFDSSAVTGVTTLNVYRGDGTQALTVADGTTVNVVNSVGHATGITIDFGATATAATVGLDKVDNAAVANSDVTFTGAKLTDATFNVTGTASKVALLDVAAAKNITINANAELTSEIATSTAASVLTITGTALVDMDAAAMDADINTIDASANTGGLNLSLGVNGDDATITGSAGADLITASTTGALATSDTLSVDAGDGTDTLVIAGADNVDTAADAARYTNFETITVAADQDASLIAGVTAVNVAAATSATLTKLSVAQAGAITVTGDQATDLTLVLNSAAGTADAVTVNLASATATTEVDIVGLKVAGVETLTLNATTGENATTFTDADTNDVTFIAGSADKLTSVKITGTKDTSLDTGGNITLAVAIDASASEGDFLFTGDLTLGSTVTGTALADSVTVAATTGSTYNLGAGDDGITAAVANIVATGSADHVINGGAGTDTLTISTAAATLTDNHFTFVNDMEKMVTGTGETSITTLGGSFNSAFATGFTLTTGIITATKDITFNSSLYAKDVTLTADVTASTGAATETHSITTGAGADTITVTGGASWVGVAAGTGGSITIDSGAGDDTIAVTVGTLEAQTTGIPISVTGGLGADSITLTHVNGGTTGNAVIVIADGDSLSTGRDKITGFDIGAGGTLFGDTLDLDSTTVATAMTSTDSGTVMSHAITTGVATFDDASTWATAITINEANLDDALGYLRANVTSGENVAFLYDSNSDGTNDATIVFNQGTLDSVIELVSTIGIVLSATNANTAGLIDLG